MQGVCTAGDEGANEVSSTSPRSAKGDGWRLGGSSSGCGTSGRPPAALVARSRVRPLRPFHRRNPPVHPENRHEPQRGRVRRRRRAQKFARSAGRGRLEATTAGCGRGWRGCVCGLRGSRGATAYGVGRLFHADESNGEARERVAAAALTALSSPSSSLDPPPASLFSPCCPPAALSLNAMTSYLCLESTAPLRAAPRLVLAPLERPQLSLLGGLASQLSGKPTAAMQCFHTHTELHLPLQPLE